MTKRERISRLLVELRGLLEKGWCQYTFSRDATGASTIPSYGHGVVHCPLGGVRRLSSSVPDRYLADCELFMAIKGRYPLEKEDYFEAVAKWNDASARTHEEVLAMVDRAIENSSRDAVDD